MADLPSGAVTFLFTDVEGSTRLWERDPGRPARPAGGFLEPPPEPLTDREVEVVRLMAEGRTNPQIAAAEDRVVSQRVVDDLF